MSGADWGGFAEKRHHGPSRLREAATLPPWIGRACRKRWGCLPAGQGQAVFQPL